MQALGPALPLSEDRNFGVDSKPEAGSYFSIRQVWTGRGPGKEARLYRHTSCIYINAAAGRSLGRHRKRFLSYAAQHNAK